MARKKATEGDCWRKKTWCCAPTADEEGGEYTASTLQISTQEGEETNQPMLFKTKQQLM